MAHMMPITRQYRAVPKEATPAPAAATAKEKITKICDMKMTMSSEKLCEECPKEFLKMIVPYFCHVSNLEFEESPNYSYLRQLFYGHFDEGYLDYENVKFDWSTIR